MSEKAKLRRFEETIVPHLPAAYNLARWMVRNAADAEDVVQDACVKAFRHFDGFRGTDGRAWLIAIVRNTALTRLRGWHGDRTQAFDERMHGGNESAGAEEALVMREDLGSLRACIEDLPDEFREAILLREMEEMSYKEIAEVTATPIGTVMSRLARARKRLEECMAKRSGEKP